MSTKDERKHIWLHSVCDGCQGPGLRTLVAVDSDGYVTAKEFPALCNVCHSRVEVRTRIEKQHEADTGIRVAAPGEGIERGIAPMNGAFLPTPEGCSLQGLVPYGEIIGKQVDPTHKVYTVKKKGCSGYTPEQLDPKNISDRP